MNETRIERDSLGEIEVPAGALYGPQTMRAVQNFPISGLKPYRAFVWSMATIKQTAAQVHMDLGLLDKERGQAIVRAAQEVIAGRWDDHFVVDPFQAGAGTSHNMNSNEVIANRANQILGYQIDDPEKPVHPNDHVNMAQSTNDTIPTAIRLGCLWRLDELTDEVYRLATALRDKALEFDDVVKSGRTHLQDAVPVRLGQEFGAYARAVERDAGRLRRGAEGLRRLGIGAIRAFTDKCVVAVAANREKAEGWLAKNAILVTALNPVIGYLKGAEVAKEAMATNRPIKEVVVEKGYLSATEASRILDARKMTEGGIHT